ncbi:MAG: hypothetical protein AAF705_20635, partial [Bacteroidota bacterium]
QKSTAYPMIGMYQKALKTYCLEMEVRTDSGEKQGELTSEELSYFQSFRPQNAVDYIIEQSKTEKVILINEAHNDPRHRVFTKSLLEGLYENGYRYLGFESLGPSFEDSLALGGDTKLNDRGYPLNSVYTGIYTREPQFANLIRSAAKLGFTIFGYEKLYEFQKVERDSAQAMNVMKVLDKDPSAKVLLYGGHAHIVERFNEDRGSNYGKTKWLGGILQELSGINPLTINQEVLTERFLQANSPYFSLIKSDVPAILVNDQGLPFNGPKGNDQYDILLYHPPAKDINGRPDWLYRDGKYKSYEVDKKHFRDFEGPYLVKAYKQSEGILAVPLDIIEVKNLTENTRTLAIPPGMYLFEIKNEQGEQKFFTDTIKP